MFYLRLVFHVILRIYPYSFRLQSKIDILGYEYRFKAFFSFFRKPQRVKEYPIILQLSSQKGWDLKVVFMIHQDLQLSSLFKLNSFQQLALLTQAVQISDHFSAIGTQLAWLPFKPVEL